MGVVLGNFTGGHISILIVVGVPARLQGVPGWWWVIPFPGDLEVSWLSTGHSHKDLDMATLDRQARIAGLWFLAVILLAPLRLIVVPSGTALDLLANVGLFRVGMMADLACGAAMLGLTLALRHLFNQVNPGWTRAVVLLGVLCRRRCIQ